MIKGLRNIVVWIISTTRAVQKGFDWLLYSSTLKCFGVTGWMFHETHVSSVVVQLTVEVRDTFCFVINQLNWDSYMERWVKGVRLYIVNGDRSALPQARERYGMQVHKQQTTLPRLNTAERNKGQICTTCSIRYWCSHIIQGHYFIHPVPLLSLQVI
jgi:hypothetical protein